jgi:radical SAM protein with 4Fe4S-binding SPASM domain
MKKEVCSAIHHGFCITAYGTVNPCCATHGDDIAKLSDINDLQDYWYNSKQLEDIRQYELTSNEWLDICKGCEYKSAQGLRTRKDKFKHWYAIDDEFTIDNKYDIVHMDISFGNSCNQQCVMCNSNFSSQWLEDDLYNTKNLPIIRRQNNLQLKNWSISYEQLDQITKLISNKTKKIEIKGGEPLYDKRFEYFVYKVLEVNEDVKFNVNTNGTHFTMKNIEMLNNIKKINIDISFDGINKVYEWIRGSAWKTSEDNFKRYLQHCNHSCNINYTTSIYNLDHIKEFFEWLDNISTTYNKKIPINFVQVVTNPNAISPIFAKKDRILDAISQLDFIQDLKESNTMSLSMLRDYLQKALTKDVDYKEFDVVHAYMTSVRGWDIKDYVNL